MHQSGIARTGNAGDADEHAHGDLDVKAIEVVDPGAA